MSMFHRLLVISLTLWNTTALAAFDHSLWDSILKTHVENGRVDYSTLSADPRLDAYLESLNQAEETQLASREEKIAFWTNAYNAYTLKLIVNHLPVSSIMDIKLEGYETPWEIPFVKVAGKELTLDHIENGILRPRWPDPRIHYALVCAARSCPKLRNEAYTAGKLETQLDDQGEWFLANRNAFNIRKKQARLSKVFEWYAGDFGQSQKELLLTIAPHAAPEVSDALEKDPKDWKISFSEWDWRLNKRG